MATLAVVVTSVALAALGMMVRAGFRFDQGHKATPSFLLSPDIQRCPKTKAFQEAPSGCGDDGGGGGVRRVEENVGKLCGTMILEIFGSETLARAYPRRAGFGSLFESERTEHREGGNATSVFD